MTGEGRKRLKQEIDRATREKLAAERTIDPYSIAVTEDGVEETVDEETLARIVAVWRDQDWRLRTACSLCGNQAYCAGPTRDRVICLSCEISGGPTKRRKRMTTKNTETVSLRPGLYDAIADLGLTVTPAKSYDRLVLDGKTVAYVNGDRKLRLDVRIPEAEIPRATGEFVYGKYAGLASVSIPTAGDFKRAAAILKAAAAKVAEPAEPAKSEPEPAKAEVEVEPDPKPTKAPRKRSTRKSPAKATA